MNHQSQQAFSGTLAGTKKKKSVPQGVSKRTKFHRFNQHQIYIKVYTLFISLRIKNAWTLGYVKNKVNDY
jgi:hypothetical protein